LKEKTGAKIVFGPTATPSYEAVIAEDNQIFTLGDIQIKVLHTPGHTMESSTYLIIDKNGKEHAIISGDTLFIGDVGRPDLVQLVKSEITEEILARHLFQSLRNKIMVLPDDIIVYPNHGAGSACGKNMSKETVDVLHETPGVVVQDNTDTNIYPMPLYAQGKDDVFVGRIRRDESQKNTLNMWIVADNLRKGAATNTIQIAEYLVANNLV